jgi:hypothetical protein
VFFCFLSCVLAFNTNLSFDSITDFYFASFGVEADVTRFMWTKKHQSTASLLRITFQVHHAGAKSSSDERKAAVQA